MRLRELTPEELTDEQRRVVEETSAGRRGRTPANVRAWLHSPRFADRAQKLGEFVRYETVLGPRLSELAILLVARAWTSHYEWFVHKREALAAGLEPAIVDAIVARRTPVLDDERTRVVHDYVRQLCDTRSVTDEMHAEAVRHLGERGVVELVGLVGYYTLVSMTLNAFDVGLPEGETTELEPGR